MAGDPSLMGRKQVIAGQPLGSEIPTQVTIDEIQVAKRPEVVAVKTINVNVPQCRLDIAQLIRRLRCKVDIQTLRNQCAVVGKANALNPDIVWNVGKLRTIAEEQPVNIRIASAAF